MLHDHLVFATVLVPEIGYLVPELSEGAHAPSTSVGRVLAEEVKVTPYFLPSDQAFWGSPFLLLFTRVHGKKPSEKPHEQANRLAIRRLIAT